MKKLLKTSLGQLARLLICLVIADGLMWVFIPIANVGPNPPYYIEYLQSIPGLEPEVAYTQNVFGFRSESMTTKAKPEDTIRVFCVGASTTDQATQSTPDMWCSQLARKLVPGDGKRIETAAYGCGGARALDVLFWARDTLPRYQPDVVVLLLGINDLAFNGGPEYQYTDLASAQPSPCSRHRGFDFKPIFLMDGWSILREYSQIARRIESVKLRMKRAKDAQAGKIIEWHSENLPKLREMRKVFRSLPEPAREPDPIEGFGDAVGELVQWLKSSGIGAVVLGQPVLWSERNTRQELDRLWLPLKTRQGPVRADARWLAAEMARYNEVQASIAAQHGVPYVDLDSRLPKTVEYYFDDCHFTDKGSQAVADAIAEAVQQQVAAAHP